MTYTVRQADGYKPHPSIDAWLPAFQWPFESSLHFGHRPGVWWLVGDDEDEPLLGPYETEREARQDACPHEEGSTAWTGWQGEPPMRHCAACGRTWEGAAS